MWLIIEIATERVFAIESQQPPVGAYPAALYDVKEWDGPVPQLPGHDPVTGEEIPGDIDPTLADPDYADKVQQRVDFKALADAVDAEIDWLNATIPNIDTMTALEVRAVVKRLAQENREMMKAWRYVLRIVGT